MDNGNYLEKLRNDLIEQFKGKQNIEVLQAALARQLADVYVFFEELNSLLRINSAEGVQLDGIGDIVVMSRAEALAISKKAGQTVPMDDETYRLYLKWKNALNTTNCTHKDRHSAMRMFWDKSPIYYSEKPEHPATIYLTISEAITDSEAEIFQIASSVKAAGVAVNFILGGEVTVTDYSIVWAHEKSWAFVSETEPIADTATDYVGCASTEIIREVCI